MPPPATSVWRPRQSQSGDTFHVQSVLPPAPRGRLPSIRDVLSLPSHVAVGAPPPQSHPLPSPKAEDSSNGINGINSTTGNIDSNGSSGSNGNSGSSGNIGGNWGNWGITGSSSTFIAIYTTTTPNSSTSSSTSASTHRPSFGTKRASYKDEKFGPQGDRPKRRSRPAQPQRAVRELPQEPGKEEQLPDAQEHPREGV
ncbi:uncharacterized protein PG986_003873 [Apiospora aurea]|uniref:Uncharacterized protein n=1 Tax=Apiospora aurea TaxID=335848 RepID=A0ABR1QMJ2_9PEZI